MRQNRLTKTSYTQDTSDEATAATIQVSDATRRMLERVRKEKKARNYDTVIQHLLKAHAQVPKSLFGAYPQLPPWNKETDRMDAHEL
jgi:hypothetical protein